jgi:hypothetical protein
VKKSSRLRWDEYVARMGQKINMFSILVRKPEMSVTLVRFGNKLEDNIKRDLTKNDVENAVKFTLQQAMKAQRGSGGIAVLFL